MNAPVSNGSQPRPLNGAGRWSVYVFLLVLILGQAGEALASNTNALHLGFSSSVFVGINENDAKAAVKMWTQKILMEHGLSILSELQMLNGSEAIANAVKNKRVDGLTMTVEEYWKLRNELLSTNAILGVNAGRVTEEYVLLVRNDSGIGRLDDLRGRSLIFFQNPRAALAPVWLETLLLKSGLGVASRFFGQILQGNKLSQTVLPVFFRKIDACVVTRRGFATMVELNPQVGRQLKVLEVSPAIIPVVFLFRADYTNAAKDQIIANIGKVRSTVASRQVLTLFQCEDMGVYPISLLNASLELLSTHSRLAEAANQAALGQNTRK